MVSGVLQWTAEFSTGCSRVGVKYAKAAGATNPDQKKINKNPGTFTIHCSISAFSVAYTEN